MSGFGVRVKVTALAVAVYGVATEVFEPSIYQAQISHGTGKFRVQHFESSGQPYQSGPDGGWPGVAVPDPDDKHRPLASAGLEPIDVEPHHAGGHRRIRRIPLDEPHVGVIVGSTRRQEGRHYPSRGDRWGEPEPAYLSQIRTVPVLQVALDTGGPARVVDVWHEDVVSA